MRRGTNEMGGPVRRGTIDIIPVQSLSASGIAERGRKGCTLPGHTYQKGYGSANGQPFGYFSL